MISPPELPVGEVIHCVLCHRELHDVLRVIRPTDVPWYDVVLVLHGFSLACSTVAKSFEHFIHLAVVLSCQIFFTLLLLRGGQVNDVGTEVAVSLDR